MTAHAPSRAVAHAVRATAPDRALSIQHPRASLPRRRPPSWAILTGVSAHTPGATGGAARPYQEAEVRAAVTRATLAKEGDE